MSTIYARNDKQVMEILKRIAIAVLKPTQIDIFNAIQDTINEYYKEYIPRDYDRKYKFLNSLIKTEVIQNGNLFTCEVKIDENYLNYQYPSDDFDNGTSTGLDVVNRANDLLNPAWHGQLIHIDKDRGFWDDAMQTLSGRNGIILLLKKNLKKYGVKVI